MVRFGFVRFINVFSVERLVNNLCTIWVGRLKLNANVARFNRENLKSSRIVDKTAKRFNKSSHNTFHKTVGNKDIGNSFVNVVKGSGMSLKTESTPTIVLDDECLNTKDLSCSLMGRVKEFTSLFNLKKVLCNEGFDVLKISYLGELWVLIEFKSAKVKDLFKENGGSNSWFSVLNQASEDFTLGGRIAWVEVEGIPFKLWSGHTFNRIASKWEEEKEDDVSVEDIHGGIHRNLNEGHLDRGCAKKVNEEVAGDDNSFVHIVGSKENSGSVNKMSNSMGSCRLKKSGMPCMGGSILSFMKEVVKPDKPFVDHSRYILERLSGDDMRNANNTMWDREELLRITVKKQEFINYNKEM
nr:nucleotide-binding alpha-beta plait domain-containing protein [Tanacetum cinerariifolium]